MSNVNRVAAGLAAAAFCAVLAACSPGSGSGGGDVATVNGQPISRATFDNRLETTQIGKQTLNQLIQQALIDQYAKNNNIVVTDAEIDKKLEETKARLAPGQFDQILHQQGLSLDDVRNILRQQIVIDKAVAPQVHVTDADVKSYFEKNHALLDKPAQVRARHILVADLATANTVEAKLKAGAKFEDLAKQYSTDPSTKDKGGELGFFGMGQMVPTFQAAAFADPVGKITPPVKSPFGYHIIQVEDKHPATKATLANSTEQIRQTLKQNMEGQQVPLFLQTLRSKANIVINDPRLQDALPPALPAQSAPPAPTTPAPGPSAK